LLPLAHPSKLSLEWLVRTRKLPDNQLVFFTGVVIGEAASGGMLTAVASTNRTAVSCIAS